jgi:hypothetical protein
MLWAIASSAFIIYLYRTLNTATDEGATKKSPADTVGAELAKLEIQIVAIEKLTGGKMRETAL